MNKKRRKEIREIAIKLDNIKYDLEFIKEDEDDSRECMPENLANSDNYIKSENASDTLEDALSNLESIVENLEELYNN